MSSERPALRICTYYDLFYMPYKRWIDLAKRKIDSKVEKCFEREKSDVLTELTKFSSSSVEMCYCFAQAILLWRLVDWPDFYGAKMFMNEIVECLSRACVRYATQVKENNANFIGSLPQQNGHGSSNSASNTSIHNVNSQGRLAAVGASSNSNLGGICRNGKNGLMDPYQKLVITTNNLEKVREVFKSFLNDIGFYKFMEAQDRSKVSGIEANTHYLETLVANTCDYLVQINEMTLETIINNKINMDLEPHMFYLFESPESSPAHEVNYLLILSFYFF
jgi:hypothetical protein